MTAAVVIAASPHLSQAGPPGGTVAGGLRRHRFVLLGLDTPTGALGGLLVAVMAAAAVHLTFGSSRGRPSLDDVAAALDGLGVDARVARASPTASATGVFLVDAVDDDGRSARRQGLRPRRPRHPAAHHRCGARVWYREAGLAHLARSPASRSSTRRS